VLIEHLYIPNISYWVGWEAETLTRLMALLKKAGVLAYCLKNKTFGRLFSKVIRHNPDKPETTALTVEVQGVRDDQPAHKVFTVKAFSDYGATAIFSAALAKRILRQPVPGVQFPFEITDVPEILSLMDCDKIVLNKRNNEVSP
jgi:hypothetical protein